MSMKLENLAYDIETHPVIVAVALFLIFFIGVNIFKKSSTTSTASTTPKADTPTVQEVYYQTYNSNPVTPPVQTPPPTPGPPPPKPPVVVTHLLIRQASTADKQKNVKNIPVKSAAVRGSTSGHLNFGATVEATGSPVIGDYNYPLSGGSGSNMWYPVSGGFVSAYDVANVTTSTQ